MIVFGYRSIVIAISLSFVIVIVVVVVDVVILVVVILVVVVVVVVESVDDFDIVIDSKRFNVNRLIAEYLTFSNYFYKQRAKTTTTTTHRSMRAVTRPTCR